MKRRGAARTEQRWRGLSVSDGAAAGRVLRLHSGTRHLIFRATLQDGEVEREARRFRAALRLVRRQLQSVKRRAERALGAEHAYIFDAHILMLEDRRLIEDVENYIRSERVNAEWAVKVVTDRLLEVYAEITDEYLRERSSDVEDVMRRILYALSGEGSVGQRLTQDAVIVVEELMPSALAELNFAHVQAIASDAGGWTSHSAIIARGLGIPAVVGLRDLYRRARTGDEIIVDATTGEVVLHPSPATLRLYRGRTERQTGAARESAGGYASPAPLRTTDGVEITLRANVELTIEYEGVRRYGARGIGLYRSEFLLSQRGAMPTEDEQYEAYIEVARVAGEDGATIRLFDLGGDKMSAETDSDGERNPALGLRAIRYCLRREEMLRTQVRALLRAAAHGRLRIVLPMVSDISEVRQTRAIVAEERARLEEAGREVGEVETGAMIEVPSAVLVADKLAREVHFFSLGTNDLVQYTLAVDRGNEAVADWFRTLHPAVLQSIRRTILAAEGASIPATVCGEMAASPAYAFVLIGLGVRDLSMTASSIPRVRRMVSAVSAARAREIAEECLEGATADDVEELVRVRLGGEWPEVFPPEALPGLKENG